MKTIIALGGSNSKNSINQSLANYAAKQTRNTELIEIKLRDFQLPLYGIDHELEIGIPEDAQKLSQIFDSADGFVVSLAEHNGSFSVAFKNAFDWLSRIEKKVWRDKPILLMAASPGPRGAKVVLESAKGIFPYLGGQIAADFSLGNFDDHFSDGQMLNSEMKALLEEKIKIFEGQL